MDEEQYTYHNRSNAMQAALLIVLQSLLYGIGDPLSKIAYDFVPVFSLLSVRYLIAVLFFLICFHRTILEDLRRKPSFGWVPPAVCIASSFLISNKALSISEATSSAFLRTISTLFTPLLGWLIYHRKLKKVHLVIYAVVLIGLYLLCGGGDMTGFGLGEIYSLLAALLASGALLFGERAVQEIRPVTLSFLQAVCSTLMASACVIFLEKGWNLQQANVLTWGSICYMGILCTGAGYLMQNKAMSLSSARLVALLQCLAPVMTGVMSYFLIGEKMTLTGMIGALMILAGIVSMILIEE